MKKFLIVSTALISATLAPLTAQAAESFYLEIGSPALSDATKAQWDELSAKHKNLLGDLKFFPKTTIDEQGKTASIIQAGVISDKKKAQKICKVLFKDGVPCFVIEGIENAPPTMRLGMSQAISSAQKEFDGKPSGVEIPIAAPIASAPAEQTTPQVSTPQVLGEIGDKPSPTHVSAPSEATQPVVLVPPVEEKPEQKPEAPKVKEKEPEPAKPAPIPEPIKEEPKAQTKPEAKAEAKVSVAEAIPVPLSNKSNDSVPEPAPVKSVTLEATKQTSNITQEKPIAVSEIAPIPYAHTNEYEARRKMLLAQANASASKSAATQTHATYSQGIKNFWAQVAIADSKAEANSRWEDIKSANSDAVGGVAMNITKSLAKHGGYSVRLGAFASESEALALCDKLQSNGVDCLVIGTK